MPSIKCPKCSKVFTHPTRAKCNSALVLHTTRKHRRKTTKDRPKKLTQKRKTIDLASEPPSDKDVLIDIVTRLLLHLKGR